MTKALQKYHSDQVSQIGPLPKARVMRYLWLVFDESQILPRPQPQTLPPGLFTPPGLSTRRAWRHEQGQLERSANGEHIGVRENELAQDQGTAGERRRGVSATRWLEIARLG
jgi:hypothetical protein